MERFAPDISWPETLKSLQREAYIEICRQEVARRDPAGDHYSTVISDELDRLLACAWRPRKLPEPVVPAVRIEEDEDD